ncbi:hypothetical protein niasHT_003207 [Heterodera trifolii]|uniref:Uncharacterized protein n=1 Tax=Heterodera trifolii TaxID=157864 RepID=A0ABD2LT34_9BILA
MLLHLFISFFAWLAFVKICCSYEATPRHSANLRALLWPIREKELPDGARISYKIYISPNKFEMNTNGGRFKMFVGGERPIRAMLGSQGGMGEFDTPISGNPENLYIWVKEEKVMS